MQLVAAGISCSQQTFEGKLMACMDSSEALEDNQACLQSVLAALWVESKDALEAVEEEELVQLPCYHRVRFADLAALPELHCHGAPAL